ncbi:MAG: arginine--tRNA ligase [Bacilli bacterium]|nr:arginine--tRNA ligase [Bacilli bacterium]
MKETLKQELEKLIKDIYNIEESVEVSIPNNKEFGDFSTNIALKLSKKLSKSPAVIAEEITSKLNINSVNKLEIKMPGFINLFVDNTYLYNNILNVIEQNENYGRNDIGKGKNYNIEFVSANPTGILHLGNARGGAYGDNLARILKFSGYDVTKEYYINDAGNQINNLGLSLRARYLNLCGKNEELPENGYHGPEIVEMAKKIYDVHGKDFIDQPLEYYKDLATKELLDKIINDLEEYGVKYDVFTSERDIYKRYSLPGIVEELDKNGYIYDNDGAKWFKSSALLDDKDHVLIKNDGAYTYLLPDIAYHTDKYKRGFTKIIDVLGTDHHGYVARLKSAMKALGYDENVVDVKLLQLVRLMSGKEIVKMSKRTGNTVTLKELVDEVGVRAARYFFAMRSLDTQMDFDMELAKKTSNENPVYYVSYAYARICTILKDNDTNEKIDNFTYLPNKSVEQLLNCVYNFPEVVKNAATKEMPHLITNYVYELANLFHNYYSNNRILVDDKLEQAENIYLIKAVKITIKNALNLVGVEPFEKM